MPFKPLELGFNVLPHRGGDFDLLAMGLDTHRLPPYGSMGRVVRG
jgi:hypothetical protein